MSPSRVIALAALILLALTPALRAETRHQAAAPATSSARRTIRVLFIGNSFVYFNDLPKQLEALTKADPAAPIIEAVHVTHGGWTLQQHIASGEALKAITGSKWDFIVLQEQSTTPITDPARMVASCRTLDNAIDKSGAQTVLMLTWSTQAHAEQQPTITRAYARLGKECDALVAPVGIAWSQVRNNPAITLYKPDGKHPSAEGTYLAACVFYRTLTGRSPVGLPAPAGIPADHAALLQKAASEAMLPKDLTASTQAARD